MLITRATCIGPIAPVSLGNTVLKWVIKSRLLGMTVDEKLSWVPHTLELKKSFAKKLNLLKRSRFLPRSVLQQLYFKVIMPSISYGLIMWGGCSNSDIFNSLERLHCRAARIIFNFAKDTPSAEILECAKWNSLYYNYKLVMFKIMHKAFHARLPATLCDGILSKRTSRYCLRALDSLVVTRFNTRFMKQSITYRGSVLWNRMTARHHSIVSAGSKDLEQKLILEIMTFYIIDYHFIRFSYR